jgi:hypothetical protein
MARSRGRSADSEQRARELRTHDRSRGARWGRERPRYTGAEVRRWLERAGEIRVAPRRTPAYVSGCSSGWGRGQRARCSSTAGADRVSARVPSSRERSTARRTSAGATSGGDRSREPARGRSGREGGIRGLDFACLGQHLVDLAVRNQHSAGGVGEHVLAGHHAYALED